jgi:hypothetical protein
LNLSTKNEFWDQYLRLKRWCIILHIANLLLSINNLSLKKLTLRFWAFVVEGVVVVVVAEGFHSCAAALRVVFFDILIQREIIQFKINNKFFGIQNRVLVIHINYKRVNRYFVDVALHKFDGS